MHRCAQHLEKGGTPPVKIVGFRKNGGSRKGRYWFDWDYFAVEGSIWGLVVAGDDVPEGLAAKVAA